MKIQYGKLIFFTVMMSIWLAVLFGLFYKMGQEKRDKRDKDLINNFSPLSNSKEVIKAYNRKKNGKF